MRHVLLGAAGGGATGGTNIATPRLLRLITTVKAHWRIIAFASLLDCFVTLKGNVGINDLLDYWDFWSRLGLIGKLFYGQCCLFCWHIIE